MKFQILLNLNYSVKILNLQSKISQKLLTELRGFKFVATLVLVFKKIESDNKAKYDTFCSNSKAEVIINKNGINLYYSYIKNIQTILRNRLGWIIDSVIEHNINISKYSPLSGSSYIKLPKELDHPRKGLINIQKIDEMNALNGVYLHLQILTSCKSSPINNYKN